MSASLILMICGWLFVAIWVPLVILSNRKVHPRALFILFFAEMWERFSYYGMRALLTLYMTYELFSYLDDTEAKTAALGVYGSYTSMAYLFPVVGGIIADKIFGFRKAVLIGGILMMLGHFALALEGMVFAGNQALFFGSLALIIIGNGYFKPNISSFVGKFYDIDDPRKDGAFSIFYMGVNIGSLLSILTCGYVGQEISWHYGFGLAGIGMGIGLLVFWFFGPKAFGDKGLEPDPEGVRKPFWGPLSLNNIVMIGTILLLPICALLLNLDTLMTTVLLIISGGIILYLIITGIRAKEKIEGSRLWVIVVLFFFHAVFWALFEQAGGSLTLFAETNVDRSLFGGEIQASQLSFLNPLFVMLLAPVFSWLWITLRKNKREPSTPMKFVLGLVQLAIGFGAIVIGAKMFANDEGMISMVFLVVMYFFHTSGELSLSPVGLSMITKLSPQRIVGFVMGAWFLSIALGNKLAGVIGQLTTGDGETGADEAPLTAVESLNIYTDTYLTWGVGVVTAVALVLFLMVPTLRRWMGDIH